MFKEKLKRIAVKLENPKYPLLGPNIKMLYWFGIWLHGSKIHNYCFYFIHVCSGLFITSEFVDLYQTRKDIMKALLNLSVSGFGVVVYMKTILFISMHSKWTQIVNIITKEEMLEMEKKDPHTMKIMAEYRRYSRVISYKYWTLVTLTFLVTTVSPGLRYVTSSDYRETIKNGEETYPFVLSSWFPFDKEKMPGYALATIVHVYMTFQGAGIVASYDANAVVVMTFLKGQAMIIRSKCIRIFGEEKPVSKREVLARIKECHRHHNSIKEVHSLLNFVLSPVMFVYILACSITICCGVVQLTSHGVPVFQKLWVVEYVSAQCFQLFLYCWHSNEVALQTDAISRSIFESNYWRSDCHQRKLLILLAGMMEKSYILEAGPFADLSLPTFVQVIKGTYSFYTLFTQMQEQ